MAFNRIIFRVDGGASIGLGHVIRCIALAHMLKHEFAILFICKTLPAEIVQELKTFHFKLKEIENDNDLFFEIGDDDIVVLDGYIFEKDYQKKIVKTGCKLVIIDDIPNAEETVADLIVNQLPGIKPSDYNAKPQTKFAIGIDFVLLRPGFLQLSKGNYNVKEPKSLLICFGGSDIKNLTERALRTAIKFQEIESIVVVTGPSFKGIPTIEDLIQSDSRITHFHSLDETGMIEVMRKAQIAIVPASGILLEALAAGCKIISGIYVDNQKLVYNKYKENGLFIDACDFNENSIHDALKKILSIPLNQSERIIDGKSSGRVLSKFHDLNIVLREANNSDTSLLFDWVNDVSVRRNSFNSGEINFTRHSEWFANKLSNQDCRIFILEYQKKPCGQIRFDRQENTEWLLDYSIDLNYRGKGFGKKIIEMGIDKLGRHGETLIAKVKSGNQPSLNVFSSLKFSQTKVNDDIIEFKIQM